MRMSASTTADDRLTSRRSDGSKKGEKGCREIAAKERKQSHTRQLNTKSYHVLSIRYI